LAAGQKQIGKKQTQKKKTPREERFETN